MIGLFSFMQFVFAQDLKLISQNGHSSSIHTLAFSGDGTLLVSHDDDGMLIVHECLSGKIIFRKKIDSLELIPSIQETGFTMRNNAGLCYQFFPYENKIDTTGITRLGYDRTHIVYSTGDALLTDFGTLHTRLTDQEIAGYISCDDFVVSGDSRGRVGFISKDTTIYLDAHTAKVKALAISPDKKYFATAGDDKAVIIWEAASFRMKRILKNNSVPITSLTVKDGSLLIGDLHGNMYHLSDLFGVPVLYHAKQGENKINDLEFYNDGKILAVTDENILLVSDSTLTVTQKIKLDKKNRMKSWMYNFIESRGFLQEPLTSAYDLQVHGNSIEIIYEHKNNWKWQVRDEVDHTLKTTKEKREITGAGFRVIQVKIGNEYFLSKVDKNGKYLGIRFPIPSSFFISYDLHRYTAYEKKIVADSSFVCIAVDNRLLFYDPKNGLQIAMIDSIHDAGITSVRFFDSKHLITSSLDGSLSILDITTRKRVLTIRIFGSGFIITDEKGNYYSSIRNLDEFVTFIYKGKKMSSLQLDANFNRPEIILDEFSAAKDVIDVYERMRTKKINQGKIPDQDEYLISAPECKLMNEDSIYFGSRNEEQSFLFSISDSSGFVQEIFLYNNDVRILVEKKELVDLGGGNFTVRKKLDLIDGDNEIRFFVKGSNGLFSNMVIRRVMYRGAIEKGDLYYIGIGVSEYKQSDFNLDYAAKDITDLSKKLKKEVNGFRSVKLNYFLNENAGGQMLDSIRVILKNVNPQDALIIHYAGHGLVDASLKYHLALYDTDFNSPDGNSFSLDSLNALLVQANCYRKTVILDACHSGELEEDDFVESVKTEKGLVKFRTNGSKVNSTHDFTGRAYRQHVRELLQRDVASTGANILAGSTGYEFSMENGNLKNGLYTWCLIQSLSESSKFDFNKDDDFSVEEWHRSSAAKVAVYSKGQQNPEARELNEKVGFTIK